MGRGRKPIPTALKLIRGNPGKRPLPAGEPQPAQILPDPPEHLGPVAVLEWHRLATELHRVGILTMADRTTLAAYCQLYEQWIYAEQYIKTQLVIVDKPTGKIIQNPMIRIAHRTLELMRGYIVELGLSPASRVKLAKGEMQLDDPLEQFLQAGKKRSL